MTHFNPSAVEKLTKVLLPTVSSDKLMQTVCALANCGERLSNAAEAKAFALLEKAYRNVGARVSMESLTGYVSIPKSAKLSVGGRTFNCRTHAMTPSAESISARIVRADLQMLSSLEQDDRRFEGVILLLDGLANPLAMKAAANAGAQAVIFCTGPEIHNMIVSEVWGSPEPKDCSRFMTIPAISITSPDAKELETLAQEGHLATLSAQVETGWKNIPVLCAQIGPVFNALETLTPQPTIIVTAHLDSWHDGAMDNASGNAAMLEMARILAKYEKDLKCTIQFVTWSGHSHGRYAGSTAWADAHFSDISRNVFLNINCDCLGGNGATVMTQGHVMAQTRALGIEALKLAADITGFEGRRFNRSCDQSFWGAGVASLFSNVSEQPPKTGVAAQAFRMLFGGNGKTGGYGSWWHALDDTADKIDPAFLVRDTKVFLAALWLAASAEILPLDIAAELKELNQSWIDAAQNNHQCMTILKPVLELSQKLQQRFALLMEEKHTTSRHINARILSSSHTLTRLGYHEGLAAHPNTAGTQAAGDVLLALEYYQKAMDEHHRQCALVALRRCVNDAYEALRVL